MLTPRNRHLEVEDIGEVTVVKFLDREILDEETIQVVGTQLANLVNDLGRRKLLLNFSIVEKMSSRALGTMAGLNKKLKLLGGRLVLCKISPVIYEAFKITNLHTILDIQKEEQIALQSFLNHEQDKRPHFSGRPILVHGRSAQRCGRGPRLPGPDRAMP